MAGDVKIREHLTILRGAAAMRAALGGKLDVPRAVHRYGEKVVIGLEAVRPDAGADYSAVTEEAAPKAQLEGLSEIERMGVEAFQLRLSPEFEQAKRNRPRDGEEWNMHGCTAVAQSLPAAAQRAIEAHAGEPTSAFLEGSVAVGIIIVEGPTADLRFTEAERTQVVAEVQNGLTWLAAQSPAAGISFTYDIRVVTLPVVPDPDAEDLEALWRDPAMAALEYAADFGGVVRYVEDNRTRFGTRWTYCAFFTKYPTSWFAYATIGGPLLVMQYANDGWGPDNIDRVFTHETGHIFGCPDEYATSDCDCGGSWGRFGFPNSNCQNCAPGGGVECLMRVNSWTMCNVTPAHFGWLSPMPAVRGNPGLLQSRFGRRGNFELVAPADAGGGIFFSWRNNDDPTLPWSRPTAFGAGTVEALTMIQSNFGSPGNLELIARVGNQLHFYYRDSGPAFRWNGPVPMFSGVRGNPVLVQSRFGTRGNFELAVPAEAGGMLFAYRNNDNPSLPWSVPFRFGSGAVEQITMIQSNFGSPGNLELIARVGNQLHFYYRDSGPAFRWRGPVPMFSGVRGNPVLVQSRFGTRGNFELAVPAEAGGMLFAYRNNDNPSLPWSAPFSFGSGAVEQITMIQSNFGSPGNLELIARVGNQLHFYYRDSGPAFRWRGPVSIVTLP